MKNAYTIAFKSFGTKGEGILTAYEKNTGIPFEIKRVYTVTESGENKLRGFHSHRTLEQVFVCISGNIVVECEDDLGNTLSFALTDDGIGLYCGPNVWHTLKYNDNAILMVLASDKYNEADYIRSYQEFKEGGNNE